MNTHQDLIERLKASGVLKTPRLIRVFEQVDRRDFVPASAVEAAYRDHPLPIGHEQTISQPSTVAFMLELLQPQPGEKILDVGSGSGWTTALLAAAVGPKGRVYGLEVISELVEVGQRNLDKYQFPWAKIAASGREPALVSYAPFNRILVSAAAETEVPSGLVDQLSSGGLMVIPVGHTLRKLTKRRQGGLTEEVYPGFVFVPLIQATGYRV